MELDLIKNAIQDIEDAKLRHKKMLEDAIDPVLTHIAQNYQINSIHFIGYTPGFNDGEPCTHSSDYGFGYDWLENYGLEDLVDEWFDDEKADELRAIDTPDNQNVNEFCRLVLDPHFEETYVTDYRVHVHFEDGTYRIQVEDYDCGH